MDDNDCYLCEQAELLPGDEINYPEIETAVTQILRAIG